MDSSREVNGGHPDPDSSPSMNQFSPENPLFVYIKMPGDIDPEDRWEKFSDPLQRVLEQENLGSVTGGGTQFSEPDENGDDCVEFCGIDVDLYDAPRELALLRRELAKLPVPDGTALIYEMNGNRCEEPVPGRN